VESGHPGGAKIENSLEGVTKAVVEAAQESLVIGQI
jgi:hypothetical protein